MNRLCAYDLSAEEVQRAQELLQAGGKTSEEIIRELRGEQATLLDPPQFPVNVQRRVQELLAQRRKESAV
ncbi:MAG: hypothetical protein PHE68_01275 [Candidatus Peribacteraceae bacterium]|nr:hypothetical protein [Candidatus Peribacteraceae bacterium]MDD5074581.1 hypothetical protein [Candidatus Peribacteraceae bacterium]